MKLPFAFEKKRGPSKADNKGHLDDDTSEDVNCPDDQSICGLSDLYFPEETDESHVRDIVDVLVDMGRLTSAKCAQLRQQCQQGGDKVDGDVEAILLKEGLVDANEILMAKAELYGLEFRHIEPEDVKKEVLDKSGLDIDFIKSNSVCPVAIEAGTLVVATCEPANIFAIEDVKKLSKMQVQVVMSSIEDIEAAGAGGCGLEIGPGRHTDRIQFLEDQLERRFYYCATFQHPVCHIQVGARCSVPV